MRDYLPILIIPIVVVGAGILLNSLFPRSIATGINTAEDQLQKCRIYSNELTAEINYLKQDVDVWEIAAYIQHRNSRVSENTSLLISQTIKKAAGQYEIPSEVLLGLIEVESTFHTDAVSSAGAIGLTQVHVRTWLTPGETPSSLVESGLVNSPECLYDPVKNIMAGAFILNKYYRAAVRNGYRNPMKRAITRYYGGDINGHYDRVLRAMGRYRAFSLTNY